MRTVPRRPTSGFTLVELLVVIGIIAVLVGILLPALSKARTSAQKAQCLSNEKQIALAILMYVDSSKGILPGPCMACVNDPLVVNEQPGDPAEVYTGATWVSGGSKMTVWDGGPYYSNRELSSTNLLQRYLGGPSNSKIWYCPASADSVGQAAPASSSSVFAGKKLGYGYMVNNMANTSIYNTGCNPQFLFGSYSSGDTVLSKTPKRVNQIHAYVGTAPALTASIGTTADTRGQVTTASKIWIISDLDGRNFYTTYSATFGVSPVGSLTGLSGVGNDAHSFQPIHRNNVQIPGGLARNYAFLDGHAEYLGFYDWPDNYRPTGSTLNVQ